jgi:hypothetical protein
MQRQRGSIGYQGICDGIDGLTVQPVIENGSVEFELLNAFEGGGNVCRGTDYGKAQPRQHFLQSHTDKPIILRNQKPSDLDGRPCRRVTQHFTSNLNRSHAVSPVCSVTLAPTFSEVIIFSNHIIQLVEHLMLSSPPAKPAHGTQLAQLALRA